MSGAEQSPIESSRREEKDILAIDVLEGIQKIFQQDIEDGNVWNEDYPEGVRTITWDDLQESHDNLSEAEQIYLSIAYEEISVRYREALEDLHPELEEVESLDEMMFMMASIDDLPKWSGKFHVSEFGTGEGSFRAFMCTEVTLEDVGTVWSVSIVDDDFKTPKRYTVTKRINRQIWQSTSEPKEGHPDEDEFIRKIHPSQRRNFLRVLNGAVMPYERDVILDEIVRLSTDTMDEYEAMCLVEYARIQYQLAGIENADKAEIAVTLSDTQPMLNDLRAMQTMIAERVEQLSY